MKLLSSAILLVVAVAPSSGAGKVCEVVNGKDLSTFSGTSERVTVPCKYNAIRALQCGSWKVTLSPSNQLEEAKSKRYIIRSLFLGLENVHTGLKWEGRTDLNTGRMYQQHLKEAPFNKKDGALSTDDVFTFGQRNETNQVSMTEKTGDFKVTFGLFDPKGDWHKSSGFRFECFSDVFIPTDFPKQLCGNRTEKEVRGPREANDCEDHRKADVLVSIFTNMNIVQGDSDCLSAARAMSNRCDGDQQYEAARLCWPLVGKFSYRYCISQNDDSPTSAFRHCVEFVCSNYTDLNACLALRDELDKCDKVAVISDKVDDTCKLDIGPK